LPTKENKTILMANIVKKAKDNPKLCYKVLQDGRQSLYLDYYLGYDKILIPGSGEFKIKHKRSKESLGLYLNPKARTEKDKKGNSDTLESAEKIRQLRAEALTAKKLNLKDKNKAKINFLDYCQKYLSEYPNKDYRLVKYCIRYFVDFVKKEKEIDYILPADITANFVQRFKNHLDENLNGETPYNYFTKMKKICKQALKDGYPIDVEILDTKNKRKEGLKKDILFNDEIAKLVAAHCGNDEVKRAFIFCLNTGLRFVDVKALTWGNVYPDYIILKSQQKTDEFLSIDLNNSAKRILQSNGKRADLVFNLPSFTSCLKNLKNWCKRAGIEKNITWHSARHSFGVNLLSDAKADIKTVSGLLGHTSLKHTSKYTRVIDKLKKEAVNNLPEYDF
jgi:integrase/recombinase XerD